MTIRNDYIAGEPVNAADKNEENTALLNLISLFPYVYASAVSAAAVGASSTAELNIATHTLAVAANFLDAGKGFEYELAYTNTFGAGNMTLALKLGSTKIADILITPVGSGSGTIRGFILGTTTPGASVPVRGNICIIHDQETSNKYGSRMAAVNVATNGGLTLQFSCQFGTNNAGNSFTMTMAKIKKIQTTFP